MQRSQLLILHNVKLHTSDLKTTTVGQDLVNPMPISMEYGMTWNLL